MANGLQVEAFAVAPDDFQDTFKNEVGIEDGVDQHDGEMGRVELVAQPGGIQIDPFSSA